MTSLIPMFGKNQFMLNNVIDALLTVNIYLLNIVMQKHTILMMMMSITMRQHHR